MSLSTIGWHQSVSKSKKNCSDVSNYEISSVQFSFSVMSGSLWPHELQHTRPPCPSPTPGVYSNSCPLSQWCHPTISTSDVPFSAHLQSFPESGSFQMSQLFTSGGQSFSFDVSPSSEPSGGARWLLQNSACPRWGLGPHPCSLPTHFTELPSLIASSWVADPCIWRQRWKPGSVLDLGLFPISTF